MPESPKLLHWAAGLSIGAGISHGLLTDAHFAEWWAYGVFFLLASMAQGIYGFAIAASHVMNGAPISARWPPSARRAWYLAGIGGNVLLIALYIASRTLGVLGEREAWDALGIFTKLIELSLVGVLVLLARQVPRA
jgi:hypothetical protein